AFLLLKPPSGVHFEGQRFYLPDVPLFVVDFQWAAPLLKDLWPYCTGGLFLVEQDLRAGVLIENYIDYLPEDRNPKEIVYEVALWPTEPEAPGPCPLNTRSGGPQAFGCSYNPRMNTAILCQDLRKRYPARPAPVDAVNGLDLEVFINECFGLLGPNGARKTTTTEILEGLLAPTSGTVEVLGRRWGDNDDDLRQRLGISLQETRLAEKLTVRETLTLFRSFYRSGAMPDAVLEQVQLTEKANA